MAFLDSFLNHTKEYESPTAFWRWAAYAAISATLRDSCYRVTGDSKLFPNIYVLILAESSAHRKDKPIALVEKLLHEVNNTKVIAGRSSIQAILDELSRGETDKKTGKILSGGSALFIAREFAASIVADPAAIEILTAIYDYHEQYKQRLRGQGVFTIKDLCFSMLAGSNEAMMRDLFDKKAIYGGLLARTFLIAPNEIRKGNTLLKMTDSLEGFNQLVNQLKQISRLQGQFVMDAAAEQAYEDWYIPFRDTMIRKRDQSGIMGRIHTGILKLSMILAANELTLEVNAKMMETAIEQCTGILGNYTGLTMSAGKSTIAEIGATLIQHLVRKEDYTDTRKNLLVAFWTFGSEDFDKCVRTLVEAGMLGEKFTESGIYYTLTEKTIDMAKGASQNV